MVDDANMVNIITTHCSKMKIHRQNQDLDRAVFDRIFPVKEKKI